MTGERPDEVTGADLERTAALAVAIRDQAAQVVAAQERTRTVTVAAITVAAVAIIGAVVVGVVVSWRHDALTAQRITQAAARQTCLEVRDLKLTLAVVFGSLAEPRPGETDEAAAARRRLLDRAVGRLSEVRECPDAPVGFDVPFDDVFTVDPTVIPTGRRDPPGQNGRSPQVRNGRADEPADPDRAPPDDNVPPAPDEPNETPRPPPGEPPDDEPDDEPSDETPDEPAFEACVAGTCVTVDPPAPR